LPRGHRPRAQVRRGERGRQCVSRGATRRGGIAEAFTRSRGGGATGLRARQAEGMAFAVLQELRDRLTPKAAADVAAQLPAALKPFWLEQERPDRRVRRIHKEEFIGRVRRRAGLESDAQAEKAVRVVFRALQRLLGSATGKEG